MNSRIFISYRREDTQQAVGRLSDDLVKHFDREQVFDDITSIVPGADFVEALHLGLEACAAMLVVMGQRWLTATDGKGQRRLDLPDDWVRQEVAQGLKRTGVRVFPVLVDGAEMPSKEDLPKDLQLLVRRQAFPLTVRYWRSDVDKLVEFLKKVPGLAPTSAPQPPRPEPAARNAELPPKVVTTDRPATASRPQAGTAHPEESAQARAPARVPWKLLSAIGAVLAIALLVFFALPQHSATESTPAPTAAPTTPQAQAATAESRPVPARPVVSTPPPPTRRVVINGPRPLYVPLKTGDVFQECAECPEMVVIVPDPNGFTIGTPDSQSQWGRGDDEMPFGPIRFAKPYAIGKFEIMRTQFRASGVQAGAGCYAWDGKEWKHDQLRSSEQPGFEQGADHPVVCVSWNEAQSYLGWLNRQAGVSGKGAYRLPSEAEWEYAARAGTTTVRYWGNDPGQACGYANVSDQAAKQVFADRKIHECRDGYVYTAPVGQFKANVFGLRDMIGNVSEWVQDCYEKQYGENIRAGSAFDTQNCDVRVLRGGSWFNAPEFARAARRVWDEPGKRGSFVGFRVARTL